MLDEDLAQLYEVETKQINRAAKRNMARFPAEFMFQLNKQEWDTLKYQFGTSSSHGGRRTLPYAFTEQGIAMLSAVLRSDKAVAISVRIMSVFVEMRNFLMQNAQLFNRIARLEYNQIQNKIETNQKFEIVFNALQTKKVPAKQGIFFNGEFFDAYVLISEIIRSAEKEIILIDNYVNDKTLSLLTKRAPNIEVTIYTKNINTLLLQDVEAHNKQYNEVIIKKLKTSHDRFLIIDRTKVYHFGASLKDAGKNWFAFSLLDIEAKDILEKL
jgi:phage regulator Rha-like protein